jgi:hypothetical protein
MWWLNQTCPAPWMFFGPMMMFLPMIGLVAVMFFMMRRGTMPYARGFGLGHLGRTIGLPDGGHTAFEEYREETLRRLDDEQREFQQFVGHLRMAKDKAEFDQFMAEHKSRSVQA